MDVDGGYGALLVGAGKVARLLANVVNSWLRLNLSYLSSLFQSPHSNRKIILLLLI